jgi:hypothetical protein
MAEFPSFAEQARNIVNSSTKIAAQVVSGGDIMVSDDVRKMRILTCIHCDLFDEQSARCTECGCFIETKSKFTTESCPLGKWENGLIDKKQNMFSSDDMPQPPEDPKEGDTYTFKGKVWRFKDDAWYYVTKAELIDEELK